ncbi:MAG: energy transducer TonB [Rhodocyclales bacterium]|nr:energy transducer TonB [Rhodocyclales bacterium]
MNEVRELPPALWSDPFAPQEPAARRAARFALVAAGHLLLVVALASLAARPQVRDAVQELVVRLIEPPPAATPKPPRPLPPQAPALPRPAPPPVLAAAAETPATANFVVAPQPPAPPRVEAVAPPPAPVLTAAAFDADYLHNPKPVYPVFSRRAGEEGKVLLRVRVSSEGAPLEIDVKQSSGFVRLDAAAREAVLKWRFVPARRGEAAIESWAVVPIVFKLD